MCVLRSELVARPFISIEISKKALFCRPPLFRNEFREILIRAKQYVVERRSGGRRCVRDAAIVLHTCYSMLYTYVRGLFKRLLVVDLVSGEQVRRTKSLPAKRIGASTTQHVGAARSRPLFPSAAET